MIKKQHKQINTEIVHVLLSPRVKVHDEGGGIIQFKTPEIIHNSLCFQFTNPTGCVDVLSPDLCWKSFLSRSVEVSRSHIERVSVHFGVAVVKF